MSSFAHAAALSLLILGANGFRTRVQSLSQSQDKNEGDCSWAKLDTSTGWGCETIKAFSGGMQGNTKKVRLTPPGGRPFFAVLKEMNSNQNPAGLNSLENERKVAAYLMSKGFDKMPRYFLDLKAKPQYTKYLHSETMSIKQKQQCDYKRDSNGLCELNPLWNQCNGNRGNIDTTVDIPAREMRTKALKCPDTQLLAMEYLDDYADLKALQPVLAGESGFVREVRAAALFLAYDEMNKAAVSHCDFNPGNAMFKKSDPRFAKIIDFGLARAPPGGDHPVGACRGNLEDIGSPGFLWLSLYRGHRNANETSGNDRRPGPWYLGANAPFDTPNHQNVMPFSLMSGKFQGRGGTQQWNKETRENWPGIVAYSKFLIEEFSASVSEKPQMPAPLEQELKDSFKQVRKPDVEGRREAPRKEPERTPVKVPKRDADFWTREEDVRPEKKRWAEVVGGPPKCTQAYADRGPGPCRLSLQDTSPCTVVLNCPYEGTQKTQTVSQDDISGMGFGGGRIEISNCNACKVVSR